MKIKLDLGARAFCLMLALMIGVLSYRSTTAILGVAGHAKNPTEGRIPADRDQADVRDNKPRPSKQRLPVRALQVREQEEQSTDDPLLRRVALLQEQAAALCAGSRINSAPADREETTRPKYLQQFLLATPHSPPL